ncbi:MAG: hypothetical protein ACJAY8_000958 [Sphingobacteriales bacterium]|jgi:uncharacterized protein (DUF2147 family)
MRIAILLLALFVGSFAQAQDVTGLWKTIDDETGKAKSIVEIFIQDGKLFGRIDSLIKFDEKDPQRICTVCPGDRKGQKVWGMEILRDMVQDGNEWEDGTIMDPKNGKIYDCGLWLSETNPNRLMVRGYVAFFFRTQEWIRVE